MSKTQNVANKKAPAAVVTLAVKANESTQKPAPAAPEPENGTVEMVGIKNADKPVRSEDLWAWVKRHAGNNPVNVEIMPLENVASGDKAAVPFVKLDKPGKRSTIIWAALNGVGKDKDRRLSAFLQEGLRNGMSKTRCADLLALMNGGYSRSSKSWGTSFVKLVARPKDMVKAD